MPSVDSACERRGWVEGWVGAGWKAAGRFGWAGGRSQPARRATRSWAPAERRQHGAPLQPAARPGLHPHPGWMRTRARTWRTLKAAAAESPLAAASSPTSALAGVSRRPLTERSSTWQEAQRGGGKGGVSRRCTLACRAAAPAARRAARPGRHPVSRREPGCNAASRRGGRGRRLMWGEDPPAPRTLAEVTHEMQASVPSAHRTRPQAANMGLHTAAVRRVPTMTILRGARNRGRCMWGQLRQAVEAF